MEELERGVSEEYQIAAPVSDFLVRCVVVLRKNGYQNLFSFVNVNEEDAKNFERLSRNPWIESMIDAAVYDFVYQLFNPALYSISYKEMRDMTIDIPQLSKMINEPECSKKLARIGFVQFLDHCHQFGFRIGSRILFPPGCGVPSVPPGNHWDRQVEVIPPRIEAVE